MCTSPSTRTRGPRPSPLAACRRAACSSRPTPQAWTWMPTATRSLWTVASQPIAANGSVTFTALADGDHSVALLGIAANCTASGSNSQTVTVHGGATAAAPFSLSCAQTGSGSGSLTVTTTTTGSYGPPNGYTVEIG